MLVFKPVSFSGKVRQRDQLRPQVTLKRHSICVQRIVYHTCTTNSSCTTLSYLRLRSPPLPTPLLLLPPSTKFSPASFPQTNPTPSNPPSGPSSSPNGSFRHCLSLAQMLFITLLLRRVTECREFLEPRKFIEICAVGEQDVACREAERCGRGFAVAEAFGGGGGFSG